MLKRLIPFLVLAAFCALPACGDPAKYSSRKVPACIGEPAIRTQGVPYTAVERNSCVTAIAPFDLAVWNEAPMNSRKIRGVKEIDLGCKALTAQVDNCSYCGVQGHSNTMVINFDPSVFQDDTSVRRAVLAVHSPDDVNRLVDAQVRGRLQIGDELVSLGKGREGVSFGSQGSNGWAFFDVTNFVARAINERRTSIYFEISVPCQTPANNLVTVSVTQKEPSLVVEFF